MKQAYDLKNRAAHPNTNSEDYASLATNGQNRSNLSSPMMTSSSAPTPVGETPLIQELNSDGTCATPELFTRPSPSPPLESESAPRNFPRLWPTYNTLVITFKQCRVSYGKSVAQKSA